MGWDGWQGLGGPTSRPCTSITSAAHALAHSVLYAHTPNAARPHAASHNRPFIALIT